MAEASSRGAFAPLRQPVFAVLWAATVLGNIGSFMRDVASSWLVTDLSASPTAVALIQTAGTRHTGRTAAGTAAAFALTTLLCAKHHAPSSSLPKFEEIHTTCISLHWRAENVRAGMCRLARTPRQGSSKWQDAGRPAASTT